MSYMLRFFFFLLLKYYVFFALFSCYKFEGVFLGRLNASTSSHITLKLRSFFFLLSSLNVGILSFFFSFFELCVEFDFCFLLFFFLWLCYVLLIFEREKKSFFFLKRACFHASRLFFFFSRLFFLACGSAFNKTRLEIELFL